jgi:hypothetical protein
MNRYLLSALIALALASVCSAQTANFIYNDGNGVPDAGTYHPGDSFSFSINLAFTPGGTISNLDGLSYWLQQTSPASPFIASVTLRDVTGSMFTDLQTPVLSYPQNLNPSNANDLGAAIAVGNPALTGPGPYLIANITVQIAPTALNGTYVLSQTLTGAKTSVISDSSGHTFAIPEADYSLTVVPEPGTWAGAALTLLALISTQRRRIAQLWRSA